jgi:glycosyltransferase involved in cell wall biosynthesis
MNQFDLAASSRHSATPAISVLMAAYNSEPFLGEALESIQSQTFSNIEIIVVNDGSTDRTLACLEAIASRDSRIRIINSTQNLGFVAALNLGLGSCRAPYIAIMDSDDIALPHRLEKQFAFLQSHPDVALVAGAITSIDPNGNPMNLIGSVPIPVTEKAIRKSLLLGPPCSHTWLARREVYEALSGYRQLVAAEDYDFLLRAVSSGFKIANIPDTLMKIRIRPTQISNRLALRQRKSQHYVIVLFKRRVNGRNDAFSKENLEKAVASGRLANALHRAAMKCVGYSFRSRQRWLKIFYLAGSAVISPWQAGYLINRARTRWICRSALNQRA